MQQTPQPESSPFGDRIPDRAYASAFTTSYQESLAALRTEPFPIDNGLPAVPIANETSQHRLICYMSITKTNKQIAEELGVSVHYVGTVLKQPRSKVFIAEELRSIAKGDIENFVKGESMNTLRTLDEMRDEKTTPAATRAAVCQQILDRALGKPTQYVKAETSLSYDDAKAELAEIDRQLSALRTQTRTSPGVS